jgi:hypothetical protein
MIEPGGADCERDQSLGLLVAIDEIPVRLRATILRLRKANRV